MKRHPVIAVQYLSFCFMSCLSYLQVSSHLGIKLEAALAFGKPRATPALHSTISAQNTFHKTLEINLGKAISYIASSA